MIVAVRMLLDHRHQFIEVLYYRGRPANLTMVQLGYPVMILRIDMEGGQSQIWCSFAARPLDGTTGIPNLIQQSFGGAITARISGSLLPETGRGEPVSFRVALADHHEPFRQPGRG